MSGTLSQIIYASQSPGSPPASGASLDTWTLTAANGSILHNGFEDDQVTNVTGNSPASGSINLNWTAPTVYVVIAIYYRNHILYRVTNNSTSFGSPGWWSWSGSIWTAVQCPIAESAEGSAIIKAGPIIFASQTRSATSLGVTLDTFALSKTNQIYHNGAIDTSVTNVIKLYYHFNTVFHKNSSNNWFSWNGSSWSSVAAPAGG